VVALYQRYRAEPHRNERDVVAEPHQGVGERLDAAAAWRAVIVHAGDDDNFRFVTLHDFGALYDFIFVGRRCRFGAVFGNGNSARIRFKAGLKER
jgi:hypothetical protein